MIYQHWQWTHGSEILCAWSTQVFTAAIYDFEAIFLSQGGSRVLPYHDIPGSVQSDAASVQHRWPS